jgi:DNA-binding protein YbaB
MAKEVEQKRKTGPLRLLAQDADDLAILSAAMQDAVAKVGDITYEAKARRLTIAFNRYCWEADGGERVRSGLQLGGVMNVQARKIRRNARDAVLEVLAVTFDEGEAPGGIVTISCAGGGDLRAVVECVDAVLADISEPWPTPRAPAHKD